MLAQAPGKNARARARRSYYKNRLVCLTVHFVAFSPLSSYSCCRSESIHGRFSAHPEAASAPGRQARKSSFEILIMVVAEVAIGH